MRKAMRGVTVGAIAALLSIVLIAVQADHQFWWFYTAWFFTVVVAFASFGVLGAIGRLKLGF